MCFNKQRLETHGIPGNSVWVGNHVKKVFGMSDVYGSVTPGKTVFNLQ